jgi:hypothetical protein
MWKWISKHWGKILICVTFLALFASLIIFGSVPGLATAAVGTTFLGIAFPTALTTASTFVKTLVLSTIIATAAPIVVGVGLSIAFGIKSIFDCFSRCCGRRSPDQQITDEISAHNANRNNRDVTEILNADSNSNKNNNELGFRDPAYTPLYPNLQPSNGPLIIDPNDIKQGFDI